jgi:hypothetical protein
MRAAKTDTIHAEVRGALENCGAIVFDAARVGRGFPDLVVNWRGRIVLIEVKAPKGTHTPQQQRFAQRWPVTVLRSAEEAYHFCGVRSVGTYVPRGVWETGS